MDAQALKLLLWNDGRALLEKTVNSFLVEAAGG
jgi:hypothetical protein